MASVEELQKKQYEMDDRFQQMVRYLEEKIRVVSVNSNLNNPHNEGILSGGSDTFKISS
jgi:hypothetical protein